MGWNRVLDRTLTEEIRELLANHRQVAPAPLRLEVRGGVAHVAGRVESAQQRALLRHLIARVRGVHAVWELLEVAGEGPLRVLDIGCGGVKQHACAVGVDRHRHPAVAVQADIERGLPFADDSVDRIYAIHFLEHVRELLAVMNEIHRVLKPDGLLHVMTPHAGCVNAVADPTHVRFFHPNTFKFFCRPYPGMRQYRPLSVDATADDVFADLQPLKGGAERTGEEELSRFFP